METAVTGRPSLYTQETADLICDLIVEGQSVRKICSLESMPSMSSVFKWLRDNEEFSKQYARAKAAQAEHFAEELLEIADDESGDVSGELKMPNSVNVQRARLKADTRKWLMSKMMPKKYGDKVENYISGPDGGPIKAEITVQFVKTNGQS